MMLISSEECQLIFLDVQEGALAAVHEGGSLLARAQLLARLARELHVPLFCTEQYPSLWGHLPQALQALAPKPLTNDTTEPKDYYVCTCGHSKNAPLCDGSHKKVAPAA